MNIIGDRLREIRKEKRKTLRDVGEDIGMSYSNLASIERGDQNCNAITLKMLADYYQVSTDYLMGNTDIRNSQEIDINKLSGVQLAFYNQVSQMTDEQILDVLKVIDVVKTFKKG